ncbi:MAG: hypothetical protein GY903_10455 [Fuerstiella sp.]|nr:hypothetical protein [Fuerstiella sp.]MCP4854899.1 hypothetical protein [Fuerstiella sp.]
MLRLVILVSIIALHGKPLPSDELPLRDKAGNQHTLLVLNSGRVVRGQLTVRTGGYDVQLPAGRMFVASEQVRFQARNMDEAYQRMRGSLSEYTPNIHMELAKWCLANSMPGRARSEVLDALHLDPNRGDARRMLEALVREQHNLSSGANRADPRRNSGSSIDNVTLNHPGMMPERRSLGGLPKSLARTFTQTIQPIVLNKCGNARCHGTQHNSFAVVSIKGGSTSRIAEQNLAAVLNQIDMANPTQSPILNATSGLHGGSRDLLFSGQSGGRQADALRKWVAGVAGEISPLASSVSLNTRPDQPVKVVSAAASFGLPGEETADSLGRLRVAQNGKFVRDAVVATRHDDFDPDIFNRRYHKLTTQNDRHSGSD